MPGGLFTDLADLFWKLLGRSTYRAPGTGFYRLTFWVNSRASPGGLFADLATLFWELLGCRGNSPEVPSILVEMLGVGPHVSSKRSPREHKKSTEGPKGICTRWPEVYKKVQDSSKKVEEAP